MIFSFKRYNLGFKILLMGWCSLPLFLRAQDTEPSADSIVHVAYGTQSADEVTASISKISGFELRKTHTATLSNGLIGKLPGVTVMQNGGAPGFDDPSFMIRGRHTTGNNGHLVLLDGLQINTLSHISPDEIESVSAMKDAAALALYGMKGANGVLLVTTKRGEISDKVNITFNARYGSQRATQLPKFAGSYDYARLYNDALANDGFPRLYSQTQLEGYQSGTDPYLYPDVNWYEEILQKSAPIQDYSLTFRGGNEIARYFVMLGYMDNQGLYANTDQERNANIGFQAMNFRANVDLNVTRNLMAQVGLGGNIQDRKFPPISTGALWQNMATYAPNLYPVRTPEGALTGSANFPNNPVGDLLERGYQSRHDRNVQANFKLTQKLDFITSGLDVFGAALFDNLFQNRYDKTRNYAYFEPIYTRSSLGTDSVYFLQRGLDTDLTVRTGNDYENSRLLFQTGFNYTRAFEQHEMGGMLMYQQDKYTVLSNPSPFAMQALMGRFNYNFQQKYFLEAAFSYFGLENYPPGHRFGFFPALSGGWLVHNEAFWNQDALVDYLKIRASAGIVGNDKGASRFNYNQYWGVQNRQGYYFGPGQTWYNGLIQLGMANPDITWEKGRIYNLGADMRLFKNKLSLHVDVFHEDRSDILVNMGNVTSALSGFTEGKMENRGRVINYGTEIEANFTSQAGRVDYFIEGWFSFARNQIKESYEIPKKEAYSYREGRPVGQYFGLEAIGFFKDESDVFSSPLHTFSAVRPGDLKYKDQNADGIIDVNDEIAIGRHSYPEVSFALNAGASYKGFNISFFLQGMTNRSVYLNGYMFQPFANDANISDWAMNGHWTPETHASATFPRLTTEPNANNYRSSTFWVRNGNVLRLRNVEFGYSIPTSLARKIGMEQVRFYVSGLNLLSWDALDVDVDPETLSMGYPVIKTYTAGLSVNF